MFGNVNLIITVIVLIAVVALISWGIQALWARRKKSLDTTPRH
jgi:hypothetical protein